jgi:hypothetical protein
LNRDGLIKLTENNPVTDQDQLNEFVVIHNDIQLQPPALRIHASRSDNWPNRKLFSVKFLSSNILKSHSPQKRVEVYIRLHAVYDLQRADIA